MDEMKSQRSPPVMKPKALRLSASAWLTNLEAAFRVNSGENVDSSAFPVYLPA